MPGDGSSWIKNRIGLYRLYDIAYGNGIYVSIGNSDGNLDVMISPDGSTWTTYINVISNIYDWKSITYGNGMFVAISGSTKYVTTSIDGINWTTPVNINSTLSVTLSSLQSIKFSNGIFLISCVHYGDAICSVFKSIDGINWEENIPDQSQSYFYRLSSSNNIFFLISSTTNSNIIKSSLDGITWTTVNLPSSGSWSSVAYGNGIYVAIGSNKVATSPDGITWTSQTFSPTITSYENKIYFYNGMFIVFFSSYLTNTYYTSTDGIVWTSRSTTLSNSYLSACVSFSKMIMISNSSSLPIVISSTIDGLSHLIEFSSYNRFRSITYGNNLFVMLPYDQGGLATNCIFTSNDGNVWTSRKVLPVFSTWFKIIFINGNFYVLNNVSTNLIYKSSDGINWTSVTLPSAGTWRSISYGNGVYVAIRSGTSSIATSSDGINWTGRVLPASGSWYDITFGNGIFIVVDSGTFRIATSSDGINWTTTVTLFKGKEIVYDNGIFIALSASNPYISKSLDGINWTSKNIPTSTFSTSYNNVLWYGNGSFITINYNNSKIPNVSLDGGETWENRGEFPTMLSGTYLWASITYGNGKFIAVNSTSTIDSLSIAISNESFNKGNIGINYDEHISIMYTPITSISFVDCSPIKGTTYFDYSLYARSGFFF